MGSSSRISDTKEMRKLTDNNEPYQEEITSATTYAAGTFSSFGFTVKTGECAVKIGNGASLTYTQGEGLTWSADDVLNKAFTLTPTGVTRIVGVK